MPDTTTAIFQSFVRDQILANPAMAASAPRTLEISGDVTFGALVHSILTNLGGFDATFVHCGYV